MNFLVLLALLVAPGLPQQSLSTGAIRGHVVDASGAAIPKVSVRILNTDRNQTSTAETDGSGDFSFGYLPVGDYELRAEHTGFEPIVRKLRLAIGQTLSIPITLSIADVAVDFYVVDSTPTIEPTRTQMAERILSDEVASTPLNGRNPIDLALLTPAVSRTNTGNNERFAETSAVAGTGISVGGQRNIGNTFIVDGLSANDDAADLALTFFGQETIREFQVVRSGGIAEFGRAYAGVINIVTQSGTNDWRGNVYGFFRNHRLDAVNVFSPVDSIAGRRIRTPLTQGQYGASAAGPLKRDRVFLFANLEREDLNRSGFITISPSNAASINNRLDEIGYAAPRVTTGAYPTGNNRTSFLAKSDLDLSERTRVAVRYSLYDIFSPNARGVGGLNAVSRATNIRNRDQTVAVNAIRVLANSAVNETRIQFIRSRFEAPGTDEIGPAINISGVAGLGASTSSPTRRNIDLYEIANNYSVQHGNHILKAGLTFIHDSVGIEFPATLFGTYSFTNLAGFLSGTYNSFGQAFGKIDWVQTNPNLGWFAQDEWRLRRNLTLNAGVRQDVSWFVDPVPTQWRTFSPRIGVSYAPGDRKTVIRSNFGLYYDRIPLRAIANAQRGDGTAYQTITLQRTQAGAPTFPAKLASIPGGVLLNLSTIDPNIKTAYSIQSGLEIEREIARRLSVALGYIHIRGIHIIMQRNLNVPTLAAADDPVNLGRPNPNFGNINQYSGQGDSYYDGMTVSVERRGNAWSSLRLSYTYSRSIDNTGNAFFSAPQDNFNLRDNRGLSDNDQRHRLTISGQLSVPHSSSRHFLARAFEGLQLSPLFTYGSPYPFNIVTGGLTTQTTPARPAGVGRNTGRGFNAATLDLRLSRKVRVTDRTSVEVIAESFNVLNRSNLQFPNNTWGTGLTPNATFGLPTGAGDPRQLQFGLRVKM